MKMRSDLIEDAVKMLRDEGYLVSDCRGTRSCFDVLAKKDKVFVVKVLINVESLNPKSAGELNQVASIISAVPLVLGDHKKNTRLSNGIIYARYGIGVVNLETFEQIISENFPVIYSVRGNYCVRIKSKLLSQIRKEMQLTQDELAHRLNVSKQSIHRYESTGRISLEIAQRLIDLLKEDITLAENPHPSGSLSQFESFPRKKEYCGLAPLKRRVMSELLNIGFSTYLTNAPFDLVAKYQRHQKRILSVVGNDLKTVSRKVEISEKITKITGDLSICISEKEGEFDIPYIKPGELKNIGSADELMEILFD